MFGEPLTVPGDIIPASSTTLQPTAFLPTLRNKVGSHAPVPTSQHGSHAVAVPQELYQCAYVFVRRDNHRTALQHPYQGPFKVICPGEKVFIIDMGGKAEKVSIDRLKPAHLDLDQPVRVAIPKQRGRPRKASSNPPTSKNTTSRNPTVPHVPFRPTPNRTNNRPQRQRRPPVRYQDSGTVTF